MCFCRRMVKKLETGLTTELTTSPWPKLQLAYCLPHQAYSAPMEGGTDWRGTDAMDWKTVLAYITGSVDQELLLRHEYLVTENRILRDQIKGSIRLSDGERKALAVIGQ